VDVDGYVAALPADVRARMEELRRLVREVAPWRGTENTLGLPHIEPPLSAGLVERLLGLLLAQRQAGG